jgi:uncharacterized protein DUF4160
MENAVPRISEFYGIVIYMYHNEHGPPHCHAVYAEWKAAFSLDDGRILEGSLPARACRMVRKWISLHQVELAENWELARQRKTTKRIEPLG